MKLAALDFGSNSFGLLVARTRRDRIERVVTRKVPLGLGDAVYTHGVIADETLAQALSVAADLVREAREHGVDALAAVGTSALRDAENAAEFVRFAAERLGIGVQVASGTEEARLVYRGARSALEALPERALVVDLGGGSVELAVGDGDELLALESLPLGFLRLRHELSLDAFLERADVARARDHVRAVATALRRLTAFSPSALVLSGGTARALGRVVATLGAAELTRDGLRRLAAHLAGRHPSHLCMLGVAPSRATTFGLGLVVLAELVELAGVERVRISRAGLREGIVLREVKRLGRVRAVASRPTWAA